MNQKNIFIFFLAISLFHNKTTRSEQIVPIFAGISIAAVASFLVIKELNNLTKPQHQIPSEHNTRASNTPAEHIVLMKILKEGISTIQGITESGKEQFAQIRIELQQQHDIAKALITFFFSGDNILAQLVNDFYSQLASMDIGMLTNHIRKIRLHLEQRITRHPQSEIDEL